MAPEGAAGSRRERNNGVEVLHCGLIEMLGSLVALRDYRPTRKQDEGGGRRLALGTTALRSPPMHRRTAFNKQVYWPFDKKANRLAAVRSNK